MKLYRLLTVIILCVTFITLSGCRGYRTENPPVHPNPNMDWQSKIKAQTVYQPLVEGVVPWGNRASFNDPSNRSDYLQDDPVFYQGKTQSGTWVDKIPTDVTMAVIDRGQDRYNIYCAVCHTKTGDGTKSAITKRGWMVPDITQDTSYKRRDGELFDIISNGYQTMPGYRKPISASDRWAIVVYVRSLQERVRGQIKDVPVSKRKEIR